MLDILLVEDDQVQAKVLSQHLRKSGYSCQVAHSSQEAWRVLASEKFRVVVADLDLGSLSPTGNEFVTELRKDRRFTYTGAIALTACSAVTSVSTALKSGFDVVVSKDRLRDLTLDISTLLMRGRPAPQTSFRLAK